MMKRARPTGPNGGTCQVIGTAETKSNSTTATELLALKRQDSGRRSIDRDRRIVLSREGCGQPREQISVVWNGEGEASGIHAHDPIRTLVRVNPDSRAESARSVTGAGRCSVPLRAPASRPERA